MFGSGYVKRGTIDDKEKVPLANWILESESGSDQMQNGKWVSVPVPTQSARLWLPGHCTVNRILRLGREEWSDQLVMSIMDVQMKQHTLCKRWEYIMLEKVILPNLKKKLEL